MVAAYIQERGYLCALETKPLSATPWGEMLREERKRYDFTRRGSTYFTFHDTDFNLMGRELIIAPLHERSDGTVSSFYVEIPAAYRQITNPNILQRIDRWKSQGKQRHAYAEKYMRDISDIKLSMEHGLVNGRETIEHIADQLLEWALVVKKAHFTSGLSC